ncbi:hypothetical protein PIB30_052468 [Stylosanthes scabra]|uniref:Uncharacterized protein n=1 Tax=Stylosanthes scabra TaxID=79078 RepID=A0ABU6QIK1_9FABA|nr:hypothetical protein [Stylosanthes scabra]
MSYSETPRHSRSTILHSIKDLRMPPSPYPRHPRLSSDVNSTVSVKDFYIYKLFYNCVVIAIWPVVGKECEVGMHQCPLGMGEALVVAGGRLNDAWVGHDTPPLHEYRGGSCGTSWQYESRWRRSRHSAI